MPCSTDWASLCARLRAEALPLEADFVARMRRFALHPAARGLLDDAAVLDWPLGLQLVATHDMLIEGVHFTPGCPAPDVAWKLLAVNLSDLAAMGARPAAVLLGVAFAAVQTMDWIEGFSNGLQQALQRFDVPLIGGDTVSGGEQTSLSLTALGNVPVGAAHGRSGAAEGDDLWVSGTIGDAGVGLAVATGTLSAAGGRHRALRRFRRPTPRLALGLALRGVATAVMDVSDGLALDAARLAHASGLLAEIVLEAIPLSSYVTHSQADRVRHATAGDDYELLFAAPPSRHEAVRDAARTARTPVARIGRLVSAPAETLLAKRIRLLDWAGAAVSVQRLGYEHGQPEDAFL